MRSPAAGELERALEVLNAEEPTRANLKPLRAQTCDPSTIGFRGRADGVRLLRVQLPSLADASS